MKINIIKSYIYFAIVALCGCSEQNIEDLHNSDVDFPGHFKLRFDVSYPGNNRATETSFESGDRIGVFITQSNLNLELAGNTLTNEQYCFNGTEWISEKQIYWDNGTYNFYSYFPHTSDICSITDLPFKVSNNQNYKLPDSDIDEYQKSDFMYASALSVPASNSPVNLSFNHILSKLTIRIIKGEDYEGEIPDNATVLVHNTVTSATIDLNVGVATKDPKGSRESIIAKRKNKTTYEAIIVPQRLDNRFPLIEVIMNGVSFLYEDKFIFKTGVNHVVNFIVDRNPEQIKIEIGGEISNWN